MRQTWYRYFQAFPKRHNSHLLFQVSDWGHIFSERLSDCSKRCKLLFHPLQKQGAKCIRSPGQVCLLEKYLKQTQEVMSKKLISVWCMSKHRQEFLVVTVRRHRKNILTPLRSAKFVDVWESTRTESRMVTQRGGEPR